MKSNKIGNTGMIALCTALESDNCDLQVLDVSDNNITDKSGIAISKAVRYCRLERFSLKKNQIMTTGGIIALAMSRNHSL
jgi:Ran GTPase-activating protein (RanGAP) involved in mRNA processing and transport